ncbi:MAG: DNA polymerase thumb domain-containing protein, partial [Halioglobus sp.]
GAAFVATLPVTRFYGVGPKTAQRMARLGIETGADLRDRDRDFLREHFGKYADYLYDAARGIDERPVRANRVRKSVGRERTYRDDMVAEPDLRAALADIVDSVWLRIEDNEVRGRTVTLKVKYADFRQITRSLTATDVVPDKAAFAGIADELLTQVLPVSQGVRLLGLSLSSLSRAGDDGDIGRPAGVAEPAAWGRQGEFDF